MAAPIFALENRRDFPFCAFTAEVPWRGGGAVLPGETPGLSRERKVNGCPQAPLRWEDSFRSLSGNPVAPGPGRLFIPRPVIDFGVKKIICYFRLRCHREKPHPMFHLLTDLSWNLPLITGQLELQD